ncbi:ATP-dependent DNA helicase RecQ [Pedobacter sp. Bi27]|uniref:RecQ family ATP-dependent DNA helicase n=1 Tax=unclassified Pedobacter TaxID=2628915 RepID=UPI001DC849A9|nr:MULTISPECIES: ATP-dependent DNA helicase RecQ [unclassified Pedobacter]CAH0133906.1 ATP-dependent DNA helicase RecQ [Pedobacter sp. Bi36]CAH0189362.1 ATP-dependent DNA helicase RecQ [Pedobacter sp. Bi126]CAH0248612.1 ATP-dependent DNA helicase RecQ [Pedobacter sp. Bi27]
MTAIEILQKYWGHQAFRPLQEDIISSVLEGKDSLALLPTGGGKSICFQVPALVKEGICIVVSPLIALMKDQVENLKSKGIEAIAIYAGMGKREIDILLDNCIYGKIKFLYLSPERLLSDLVRVRISYMNVNLIAVDEAHCISQWGYDFRPPYQKIAKLREILPNVPVLALTATATEFVRKDIVEKLEMKDPQVFVKSFARDNLSYVVFGQEDKYKKLIDICQKVKGTGLVYVRNRRETAEVANFINRNQIKADFYHAGLERDVRFLKQEEWKNNKTRIMVATNAFGMGIDKADVRFVVHLDLPESLEAYYQEAGRAGRDEKRSYAVLLANQSDVVGLESRYLDSFPTPDEIRKTYHYLGNYFQLAFGAGEGLTFTFDVADFCKRFNISVLKTISALKFLEHDGYITLSESVFLPSRMMFIASHEDIYRFQIENKAYDGIIKTILRSHGGAFDGFVKINEADLAKKTGLSYKEIIALLNKLQAIELLTYTQQTDQPQLQYIRPRVDMDHFDLDVKYLELRKEILHKQINAVVAYASSNLCRSIQLLHYFDEDHAAKCGVCDVCLAEKRAENQSQMGEEIEFEIVSLLQQQPLSLDDLVTSIKNGAEAERIDTIRELLDAGKIKTDGKKYYL